MDILNTTPMVAGCTLGLEPDGREHLVIVVKGTYDIPMDGGEATLAQQQVPLVAADEFIGEPGVSAPTYESDYVPYKPKCDVLLNGSAYAPGGRPINRVTVSLRVGPMTKSFEVVGSRVYDKGLLTVTPGTPTPFTRMSIHYGNAFGGVDRSVRNPDKAEAYSRNPVGVGFYPCTEASDLVGKPLPNTEETGRPVKTPTGKFNPMALGPIGRNFDIRPRLAGTYDDDWLANIFPFLPADFDPQYYQSAPVDQQIPYPQGGELVELVNLAPKEHLIFRLPVLRLPVEFTNTSFERTEVEAPLDTILIEPDLGRIVLAWRTSFPLKRNLFEVYQCIVGRMPAGWYRARAVGKTYHRSIRHLVTFARGEEIEGEGL